ncbi:ERF family protein [Streptococcus suis]|uniref:ERF family protein n=1 Tax=Streptococcus suis TaxID=1307 RepID=UPI0003FF3427|nr:ERF family protein [Streptococcus suis]MCB2905658.1 ERF family protein [Streptococcus suis]MDS1160858.1 ERF family protein [Streptococcus suis]MEE3692598.1 ERF family protein [Streptococcus suis]MEE3732990.1 ERF family protein [Streptococcus suis]HEL2022706.1 ERF family protein [Streptococcus suis]
MAKLTFSELQRQMQLVKKKSKDVKYAFRNAEDIYTAFKELKSDWAVIVKDELIELAGKVFIKAVATALNDETDEKHSSTAFAELSPVPVFNTQKGQIKQMQEPQWTGAVSSYARKYALQGLFAIGEKDVDEYPAEENQQGQANQQPQQEQAQYITNEQYTEIVGWIRSLAQALNKSFDEVEQGYLKHYQITDFHQVPIEYFDTVVSRLKSQVDKYNQPQNDFNSL